MSRGSKPFRKRHGRDGYFRFFDFLVLRHTMTFPWGMWLSAGLKAREGSVRTNQEKAYNNDSEEGSCNKLSQR